MKCRSKKLLCAGVALGVMGLIFFLTPPYVSGTVKITMATNGLPYLFGIPMPAGASRDLIFRSVKHSRLKVEVSVNAPNDNGVAWSNAVQTFIDLERSGLTRPTVQP